MSVFPANATLIFQVPTGSGEIDELGNPLSATEPLIVAAYLREVASTNKRLEPLSDGEFSRVSLEGRIVGRVVNGVVEALEALPETILPGAKAQARVGNLTGDFFVEPSIASVWGVESVLGSKIRGTLLTEVAWGEAL